MIILPNLLFLVQHPLLVDQSTSSLPSYKIYRAHSLPSYSIVQRQFKRERYRRTMIDRLFSQFDEDGLFLE